MLEQQQAQLVAGLQDLYRRTQTGQGWEGSPLQESDRGTPLTHDILDRLGALKVRGQNPSPERFEENVDALQQRLFANGAGPMQRTPSDSGSDSPQSPAHDQSQSHEWLSDPFTLGQMPPTPPSQSPFPQDACSFALPKKDDLGNRASSYSHPNKDHLVHGQTWSSPSVTDLEDMELLPPYDSPVELDTMPHAFDTSQMPIGTIAPYLSMRVWNNDVDFHPYFSAPTI